MLWACWMFPIPSIARFRSIWSSSSLRSISTSTVGLSALAALNSSSAALIIVNVLPLPCVCHTSPRRGLALGRSGQAALNHLFHRRRLVLAEDELLQLLVLLREQDVILQQRQHVAAGAEALDLRLQVPLLLVLPVEDVSADQVPRDAVGKPDCLGRREHHLRHKQLRRLGVIAAHLVHAQRDRLVLRRVLALDHQHRNAVDQKDDIFARAVFAVVTVKLLGHLENVVVRVVVVDQDQGSVRAQPLCRRTCGRCGGRRGSRGCRQYPNEDGAIRQRARPAPRRTSG